jgi:hypothetical protein
MTFINRFILHVSCYAQSNSVNKTSAIVFFFAVLPTFQRNKGPFLKSSLFTK